MHLHPLFLFFCGKIPRPIKAVQVLAFTSTLDCKLSSASAQKRSTWTMKATAGEVDWHLESV